jgi:exocyst complex component 3
MEKARFQLSEKLRHPSDLQTKLGNIEKVTKEIQDYHNQNLYSMISRCYTSIADSSRNISELGEHHKAFVRNNNRGVKVLKDFFSLVKDYKSVKMVCQAHANLCRVNEFSERLRRISEPVFSDDILVYHNNVYEGEDFMCQLELYNSGIPRDEYIEISKAINIIERNALEFMAKVLELCEDFVENHKLVPMVLSIIEREERRDDLTRRAQEGEKSDDPVLKEIFRMYRMYATRKPKRLREKVAKAFEACVRNKFDGLRSEEIFVNKMGFILEDLSFIRENVDLGFYSFDDVLVLYHRNLKLFLDESTCKLDAGEILAVVEYVTSYYNTIESRFNKIADALGERLLTNETELLEKYSQTAIGKLKEWITNITKMEVEKFYARNEELPRDEENKLISPGFIGLLQIIKMQLEPIAFNKRIFAHITRTVRQHCEIFKESLVQAMENDFIPACEMTSKAGYEDFCIMFGNSGLKVTQYITSLPQCQSEEVRELGNIFIDILKASNTFLSDFIIYSCQPAIDKIFTDEWYRDGITKIIVLTLEDYLGDYMNTMSDYSFLTFIHELSSAVTLAYMKQLGRKRATIGEKCGALLKADYARIAGLMCRYGDEDDVKTCLSPILKIVPLMETRNSDLFIVETRSLKMIYPDIKRSFIKSIIKKRRDLSDEERDELIDRLKECFGDVVSNERTIFSRLLNL